MEIFLNNQKLEFQLEREKNLKEVIESINDWLFEYGKVVDQIIINDNVYENSIESLEAFPIEKTKVLKLTTIDIDVLVRNSLAEVQNYLNTMVNILKTIKDFSEEELDKIIYGTNWVYNILSKCDKLYKYSAQFNKKEFNFVEQMEKLKESADIIEKFLKNKDIKSCVDYINENLISQIEKWLDDIDKLIEFSVGFKGGFVIDREKVAKQIYNIIIKIPDILKLIEVTVVDLQSGEEKEAMKNIQVIIGTLESIVALLQIIKNTFSIDFNNIFLKDKSIEEINNELKIILNELAGAMENQDAVLIADLLEYEFHPRLEKYVEILKIVANEINLDIN